MLIKWLVTPSLELSGAMWGSILRLLVQLNLRGERLLPQLSQRQASAAVTASRHLVNLSAHFSNRALACAVQSFRWVYLQWKKA